MTYVKILFLLLLFSLSAKAQRPWVSNASRPYPISMGLDGRHIALWASHGRYYDQTEACWRWQR